MSKVIADKELISSCGLYCGACPRFLKGKCAGCRESESLSWCRIRTCNQEHGFHTCADCNLVEFSDCKLNHNLLSKFFAALFGSDRDACIARIKDAGADSFAEEMAAIGSHTIKRKKRNS